MATDTDTATLYLRKSSLDEGRSVARQLATLTESAESEGLTVGKVFCDPDFSASRFAKRARPDYAELVAHIESGECRIVGLFEGSRGSRQLTEWSQFLDLCAGRRVRIWIHDDRIYRPWRTNDWDTLARIGVASATESNLKSDRTLDGKRAAARDGRPPGRIPYGFARSYRMGPGGKMIGTQHADPDEAPVVDEMVRRVANRESLQSIARELARRGITTRAGKPWRPDRIRDVVMNPSNAGRRVHQGKEIGAAKWDPIVDVDEWRRAMAILSAPERKASVRGTALSHWLSGAALCGACRAERLRHGSRSGGCGSVYRCKGCKAITVTAPGLESTVEAAVLARLGDADVVAALFAPAVDTLATRRAEDHAETLRIRLEAHYVESARGKLSARGLTVVEGELLPEIERAEAEVRRLKVPADLAEFAGVDVVAKWGDYGPETRRRFVRALADIVVMPATRRGRIFDPTRLDESRWRGDELTWGERRSLPL